MRHKGFKRTHWAQNGSQALKRAHEESNGLTKNYRNSMGLYLYFGAKMSPVKYLGPKAKMNHTKFLGLTVA